MSNEIYAIIGVVFSFLFSGNIFFIKRLIDKLENSGKETGQIAHSVTSLSHSVAELSKQLTDLKIDIKELKRVEIEVAVLKAHFENNSQHKKKEE